MIHELVHQWWGLGNMFDVAAGPWSAEGLTVYTTYRIVKDLYDEDYAQKNYVESWRQAVDDYNLNFYVRNPEYLAALPEEQRLEITGSLAFVRQYCEMPLKILKAEELVGGEEAMDRILHDLFNRELDPMYPYLTYQDFLSACGLTGGSGPCVKFFVMSCGACCGIVFFWNCAGAFVLRLAGAGRGDHIGRVPYGPVLALELRGLFEPDAPLLWIARCFSDPFSPRTKPGGRRCLPMLHKCRQTATRLPGVPPLCWGPDCWRFAVWQRPPCSTSNILTGTSGKPC